MKYFIANWKANKNLKEAEEWLKVFSDELLNLQVTNTIIICPPAPLIYFTRQILNNSVKNIYLGAQDLSSFEAGNFTGEVPASSLINLVNYVIIGHSERRKYFEENDEILAKKISLAKKYQIEPILCIRGKEDNILDVNFVAYEPVSAIGTGKNKDIQEVISVKKSLSLGTQVKFLYGGSVNENNAQEYINSPEIDGLLIGTASLYAKQFIDIINA